MYLYAYISIRIDIHNIYVYVDLLIYVYINIYIHISIYNYSISFLYNDILSFMSKFIAEGTSTQFKYRHQIKNSVSRWAYTTKYPKHNNKILQPKKMNASTSIQQFAINYLVAFWRRKTTSLITCPIDHCLWRRSWVVVLRGMTKWIEHPSSIYGDQGFEPDGFEPCLSQTNDIDIDTCRYLAWCSALGMLGLTWVIQDGAGQLSALPLILVNLLPSIGLFRTNLTRGAI